MTNFLFGTGPNGPWIETGLGRVDVTPEELAEACEQHGIKVITGTIAEPKPAFRPAMELGWSDCDPVATCYCGARCKGDSVNDALIAWGQHLATVHRGEW